MVRTALIALLLAGPAVAEPVHLDFAAYVGGLKVAQMDATLDSQKQRYRIELGFRLAGPVGAVFSAQGRTVVDGVISAAGTARPRSLSSSGVYRGTPHVTELEWRDGRPVITRLEPPDTDVREKVPEAEQDGTVDTLSAVVVVLRDVARSMRCDSEARTFDGRRLSALQARTVGMELLAPSDRSSFSGPALRCDFEGRMLAGFVRGDDSAAARRPLRGSAWFARLQPGGIPVPVRMVFQTRGFGEMTAFLAEPP